MFMQTCFCKCYKGDTYKLYHSYIWLPITWKLISLFVLRGARAGFPRYPLKAAAMFAFRSARNLCLSWLWNYIAAISVITGCPPRLFHRRYIVISYRSFTPTSLKQTLYEYVARRWAILKHKVSVWWLNAICRYKMISDVAPCVFLNQNCLLLSFIESKINVIRLILDYEPIWRDTGLDFSCFSTCAFTSTSLCIVFDCSTQAHCVPYHKISPAILWLLLFYLVPV